MNITDSDSSSKNSEDTSLFLDVLDERQILLNYLLCFMLFHVDYSWTQNNSINVFFLADMCNWLARPTHPTNDVKWTKQPKNCGKL